MSGNVDGSPVSHSYSRNILTLQIEYNSPVPADQWDMTELDVNVTVNMALLEYKIHCNMLDPEDLQRLFRVVHKQTPKTDMVSWQLKGLQNVYMTFIVHLFCSLDYYHCNDNKMTY